MLLTITSPEAGCKASLIQYSTILAFKIFFLVSNDKVLCYISSSANPNKRE